MQAFVSAAFAPLFYYIIFACLCTSAHDIVCLTAQRADHIVVIDHQSVDVFPVFVVGAHQIIRIGDLFELLPHERHDASVSVISQDHRKQRPRISLSQKLLQRVKYLVRLFTRFDDRLRGDGKLFVAEIEIGEYRNYLLNIHLAD